MKKYFIYIIVIVLSFSLLIDDCKAQSDANISSSVVAAIKSGNAKELATCFNSNIELTVPDKDGTYSKSQAEIIMKDFFQKHPPKSFSINHNGSSKDMSKFFIGSYMSGSEEYRIYFLMKSMSGKMVIQQLQIEE